MASSAHGAPHEDPALRDAWGALVETARRTVADGLVVGTSGNVSVRVGDLVLVTPTGVPYDRLTPADALAVDLDGRRVLGSLAPTSELPLHLALYRATGAGAVVHTHAVHATAVSTLVDELPPIHYMTAALGGPVRVAPYALYGTPAARRRHADRTGRRSYRLPAAQPRRGHVRGDAGAGVRPYGPAGVDVPGVARRHGPGRPHPDPADPRRAVRGRRETPRLRPAALTPADPSPLTPRPGRSCCRAAGFGPPAVAERAGGAPHGRLPDGPPPPFVLPSCPLPAARSRSRAGLPMRPAVRTGGGCSPLPGVPCAPGRGGPLPSVRAGST